MAIMTNAGASLAVSATAPGTYDNNATTGYPSLVHTLVGEISNIGEFLRQYELVTFNDLASRGTRKLKGTYNNGQITPSIALDFDDAGQAILETARDSDGPIACVVTLQDGTEYHFMGLVMAFRPNVGEPNAITMATCSIEVTHHDGLKIAAA